MTTALVTHLECLDHDMGRGHPECPARLRAVLAVDLVMGGAVRTAFAAVRPPGHHAEPSRPMGFCLFNNAAIAAVHARAVWGVNRVAVLDFDVHHGNGTQTMFAEDPGLFYGSSHQDPCFPGTGHAWEHGVAHNIVNIGLKPGSGSEACRAGWDDIILPARERFAPAVRGQAGAAVSHEPGDHGHCQPDHLP